MDHLAALLTAETSDYSRDMATASTEIQSDEATWIAQAQRADSRAFEALYRMHIDRVYGLCLRMTGNASEADDCAQEFTEPSRLTMFNLCTYTNYRLDSEPYFVVSYRQLEMPVD